MTSTIVSSDEKIYAARYLDLMEKQSKKLILHIELHQQLKAKTAAEARTSADPLTQLFTQLDDFQTNYVRSRGAMLNAQFQQISPGSAPIYYSPEELENQKKAKLKDGVLRVQIARKAIALNVDEKNRLYPNIASLYQEQVSKRKWYKHGGFFVAAAILLLPLSPLFYFLWKRDRNDEMIQPNLHSREGQAIIRRNRQDFKNSVNRREEYFMTLKEKTTTQKEPAPYVTVYKKQRDAFFLTPHNPSDIQYVKDSIYRDKEFRLDVGIR